MKNKNNIRTTWQIINRITGKNTQGVDEIIKLNYHGNDISEIVEKFATNFNENVKK